VKTLGLIGGMSWESTAVYYRLLNQMTRARLGGLRSAALILHSFDFAPLAAMQAAGDWEGATAAMIAAARGLERAGAEALVICANTMHRMADEVAGAVAIPLIHIADVTARAIKAGGASRPLLLATRYTMEQDFYRRRLAAGGVAAIIPLAEERERLQAIIYEELVQGRIEADSRDAFMAIVERARRQDGADAAILGCTEFSLLVGAEDLALPAFDTTALHAEAALEFALGQGNGETPKA
jgi:aspartate racemase